MFCRFCIRLNHSELIENVNNAHYFLFPCHLYSAPFRDLVPVGSPLRLFGFALRITSYHIITHLRPFVKRFSGIAADYQINAFRSDLLGRRSRHPLPFWYALNNARAAVRSVPALAAFCMNWSSSHSARLSVLICPAFKESEQLALSVLLGCSPCKAVPARSDLSRSVPAWAVSGCRG